MVHFGARPRLRKAVRTSVRRLLLARASLITGNFHHDAKPRLTFPIQYTAGPGNQVANQLRTKYSLAGLVAPATRCSLECGVVMWCPRMVP
jgi:hypothetical protein